ncbi:MAG: efflux RND transporter periplasmic adaptor subunit [Ginsengibacter sp.]
MKIYLKIMLVTMILITQMSCEKKEDTENSLENTLSDSLIAALQTKPVTLSKMVDEIKLNGHVTTNENLEAHVYALVSGKITNVYVENGDQVKKGQVLATIRSIETVDISNQVAQSENLVEIAGKNVQWQKELFKEKMATMQEVTQAEMDYKMAVSELSRSKQLAGITGGSKGVHTLKAPISGHIIHKAITTASEVRSDNNDILFTVADLSQVWIMANVFESDIEKIHPGYPVQITTLSNSGKTYEGKIDKIYNVLDNQTRTMKVRVNLKNEGGELKPGMFASVKVMEELKEPQMMVPSQSIVMDNSKHYVILRKGRSLETREIKIIKRINGNTFLKNVEEGEEVVIENALFLFENLNTK